MCDDDKELTLTKDSMDDIYKIIEGISYYLGKSLHFFRKLEEGKIGLIRDKEQGIPGISPDCLIIKNVGKPVKAITGGESDEKR